MSDLLELFKSMDEDEIVNCIIDILGNNYKFNNKLDDLNPKIIHNNLEELLVRVTGIEDVKSENEALAMLVKFAQNVKNYNYQESNEIVNKKQRNVLKRIIALVLSLVIASTMYFNAKKSSKEDSSSKINRATYVTTLSEEDDMLASGAEFVELVSDVINENITLEEATKNLNETQKIILTQVVEGSNSNTDTEEEIAPLSIEEESNDTTTIEEVVEVTIDDKINAILVEYNLTYEEFDILAAIVMGECKNGNYIDAYAVINTIYNRTISSRWVRYANKFYDDESYSTSLYYQAILSGQFEAYENRRYEQFLGVRDIDSFYAVVDFLTTKNILHDYLSFRSNDTVLTEEQSEDARIFTDGGNQYFHAMEEEDRLDVSTSYSR